MIEKTLSYLGKVISGRTCGTNEKQSEQTTDPSEGVSYGEFRNLSLSHRNIIEEIYKLRDRVHFVELQIENPWRDIHNSLPEIYPEH